MKKFAKKINFLAAYNWLHVRSQHSRVTFLQASLFSYLFPWCIMTHTWLRPPRPRHQHQAHSSLHCGGTSQRTTTFYSIGAELHCGVLIRKCIATTCTTLHVPPYMHHDVIQSRSQLKSDIRPLAYRNHCFSPRPSGPLVATDSYGFTMIRFIRSVLIISPPALAPTVCKWPLIAWQLLRGQLAVSCGSVSCRRCKLKLL